MYFSKDLRGTFSIPRISTVQNGERRFNPHKFRTVLNNINLSPRAEAKLTCQDQIVAFVSALEDLTNHFCEQDKPMIYREITGALLAKQETRSNGTCIKQAEMYIRNCFSHTNFIDYPRTTIDIMLDQVPTKEKAKWESQINNIIQNIKDSYDD